MAANVIFSTVILYRYPRTKRFLFMATADGLLFIATVTLISVLGDPLAYLDCPTSFGHDQDFATTAQNFALAMGSNFNNDYARDNLFGLASSSPELCHAMRAWWGIDICICIFLLITCPMLAMLGWEAHKQPDMV